MNGEEREVVFTDEYILFNDKKIGYESLFTKEFYSYADSRIEEFNFGTIVDNSLYVFYIRYMLSITFFLSIKSVKRVRIEIKKKELFYIVVNAVKFSGIPFESNKSKLCRYISFDNILMLVSFLYLLCVQLFQCKSKDIISSGDDIWICRSNVVKKKYYPIKGTSLLEESKIGRGSIYTCLPRRIRIQCVIKAYAYAKKEYERIKQSLNINELEDIAILANTYFAKRLVHVFFWGLILEEIIKYHNVKERIYSGVYNCAYAKIESIIAKKMKKQLVVIPHGVQSSFKYPNGLSGDTYYATSECEAEMLNRIYDTNKYIFDENVVKKMYKIKSKKEENGAKDIVFFTDGNGNRFDVLLSEHLQDFCEMNRKILHIKYHDGERIKSFSKLKNIIVESDINRALDKNICIARYSSVLVDAIYGDSASIQVIMHGDAQTEADLMPSLHDSRIIHVRGIEELDACLKKLLIDIR